MRKRIHGQAAAAVACALLGAVAQGVTPLPSADGQFWDVQDTSPWSQDSGGIATGGRSNPFNGFGYLKLQVRRSDGTLVAGNQYLRGFGLAHDRGERMDSITPVVSEGIVVARALFAPKEANYLRYFDAFTNASDEERVVEVAWGGAAGAFEDGGRATVATTGSGDRQIDAHDAYVVMMQNARGVDEPMKGPSGHGPSAHLLGTKAIDVRSTAGDMYGNPFVDAWPGFDPAHIGYVFTLRLKRGETAALVTFVVKGLSETYDPRGGFPTALRDGLVAENLEAVYAGNDANVPAAGSEILRVTETARKLVREPDLRGLTRRQRAQIVNWKLPNVEPLKPFSVAEKTVTQLQNAMQEGVVTSEDIVREYLVRASLYDRSGPTFRAILALNPRVVAEARERDAERAAGRAGAFLGVPVLFKDNIDVLGLPTTAGSRALVDNQPRLNSRVAEGMRRGGAVVLGKANLDEFPFGDFGISTLGGTVGNAFDPSLSTAGSSGGSATAVATSLAPLAFGTDTCNSLSNPSAFASLATIRATRGLVSRAGVMPLNPYNDAVGPMAKSVRDVALALDLVAGTDHDDPVTAEADAHLQGSFAEGLEKATLAGRRIGVLCQRFVGVTGEREAAEEMERVVKEFETAGATVFDVSIDDYDAKFAKARGSAPGSLKAGWEAYLSRGAKAGDKILTIEKLVRSGKLTPAGTRRLEAALAPGLTGAELDEAVKKFVAGRAEFRQVFIDLMNERQADALLYPANVARPHTHEGGLERYGTEPGTCEESALTGLPQVTVPAGYFGGRFPFGVSLLGRPWDDRKLLELAAAYERATKPRRISPLIE